jgi:hypothetical protein
MQLRIKNLLVCHLESNYALKCLISFWVGLLFQLSSSLSRSHHTSVGSNFLRVMTKHYKLSLQGTGCSDVVISRISPLFSSNLVLPSTPTHTPFLAVSGTFICRVTFLGRMSGLKERE